MSPTVIGLILSVLGGLTMILLGIIGWIGAGMNDNLKNIANSVSKIEKELGVLSNDHANLKSDVYDVRKRVAKLEDAA